MMGARQTRSAIRGLLYMAMNAAFDPKQTLTKITGSLE